MVSISPRTWTNATGKTSRGFRLSYKDRDGKRRFKQFKRRTDAEKFRDEELPKILSGALVPVSEHDWTVSDAADHWLKACEKGRAGEEPLAAPTLDQYTWAGATRHCAGLPPFGHPNLRRALSHLWTASKWCGSLAKAKS